MGKNTYNDRAKRPPAFLKKLILVGLLEISGYNCKIKRDLHSKLKFDQDFIYHKYP